MFSFFRSQTGYISVEDEEELKLGGDVPSRASNVTIKISLYTIILLAVLFLSSIISTWILFFGARNLSQHDTAPLVANGLNSFVSHEPTPFTSTAPSWVCQRPTIRREWRTLSEPEKLNYITAVKCLATKPSKLRNTGTLYDDFAWVHKYLSGGTSSAHVSASFLPWHRYFIHLYEKSLKEECAFDDDLPYWDWSLDWSKVRDAPVWDSNTGLGGDGFGSESVGNGKCVTSGPFSNIKVMFYDGEVQPHCLSRGFPQEDELKELGELIRPEFIKNVMNEDEYESFASGLETRAHKFLTHSVRGDLSRLTGPNDPVFFLHHVNLDRLWWQWQQAIRRDRLTAYGGRAYNNTEVTATLTDTLDMGGLSRNMQVVDVMDTTAGQFCYGY